MLFRPAESSKERDRYKENDMIHFPLDNQTSDSMPPCIQRRVMIYKISPPKVNIRRVRVGRPDTHLCHHNNWVRSDREERDEGPDVP
jgi:hypothetical protein